MNYKFYSFYSWNTISNNFCASIMSWDWCCSKGVFSSQNSCRVSDLEKCWKIRSNIDFSRRENSENWKVFSWEIGNFIFRLTNFQTLTKPVLVNANVLVDFVISAVFVIGIKLRYWFFNQTQATFGLCFMSISREYKFH